MESFVISNFKFGLDTRRSELTSQPGTAMTLENGHVNSGGEIEKRKALVTDPTSLAGTFGIEATSAGLVVFGSQPDALPLPAGVVYQRCRHPAFIPAGPFPEPVMTAVLASCNFNGKAFVIARFDNGSIVLFYDGVAVSQSIDGTVEEHQAGVTSQSAYLWQMINAIEGWTAVYNGDGSVTITSPQGVYFTPVPEKETDLGLLGFSLIDKDHAGADGTSAVASFQILTNGVAGVDSYKITAPLNSDGSGVVTLCMVLAGASVQASAAAIAAGINDNTYLTGYTATPKAGDPATDKVFVYAPIEWGALANGYNASMTATGGTIGGGGAGSGGTLHCNISQTTNETILISKGPNFVFSKTITASGVGGTAPYTYLWTAIDADGITIGSPNAASTNFSKRLALNTSAYGTFKCTVKDSASPAQGTADSVTVTVLLENTSNN